MSLLSKDAFYDALYSAPSGAAVTSSAPQGFSRHTNTAAPGGRAPFDGGAGQDLFPSDDPTSPGPGGAATGAGAAPESRAAMLERQRELAKLKAKQRAGSSLTMTSAAPIGGSGLGSAGGRTLMRPGGSTASSTYTSYEAGSPLSGSNTRTASSSVSVSVSIAGSLATSGGGGGGGGSGGSSAGGAGGGLSLAEAIRERERRALHAAAAADGQGREARTASERDEGVNNATLATGGSERTMTGVSRDGEHHEHDAERDHDHDVYGGGPGGEGPMMPVVPMPMDMHIARAGAGASAGAGRGAASSSMLDLRDMRRFLTSPVPFAAGIIQCYIERDRSGVSNRLYPVYSLYLKDGDRFLCASRKRSNNKTSNYLISQDKRDLNRDSASFLGKLRANFVGTEFVGYDDGAAPDAKPGSDPGSSGQLRTELAVVNYASNVLGSRGPRKMKVAIPKVSSSDGKRVVFQPERDEDSMMTKFKNGHVQDMVQMINKPPKWNDQVGAYVLNFNGRVTMASVKNFQLVSPEDHDTVLLQFGRTGKDTFTMDFQWPLCPLQAFLVCMSSFDYKLACE